MRCRWLILGLQLRRGVSDDLFFETLLIRFGGCCTSRRFTGLDLFWHCTYKHSMTDFFGIEMMIYFDLGIIYLVHMNAASHKDRLPG